MPSKYFEEILKPYVQSGIPDDITQKNKILGDIQAAYVSRGALPDFVKDVKESGLFAKPLANQPPKATSRDLVSVVGEIKNNPAWDELPDEDKNLVNKTAGFLYKTLTSKEKTKGTSQFDSVSTDESGKLYPSYEDSVKNRPGYTQELANSLTKGFVNLGTAAPRIYAGLTNDVELRDSVQNLEKDVNEYFPTTSPEDEGQGNWEAIGRYGLNQLGSFAPSMVGGMAAGAVGAKVAPYLLNTAKVVPGVESALAFAKPTIEKGLNYLNPDTVGGLTRNVGALAGATGFNTAQEIAATQQSMEDHPETKNLMPWEQLRPSIMPGVAAGLMELPSESMFLPGGARNIRRSIVGTALEGGQEFGQTIAEKSSPYISLGRLPSEQETSDILKEAGDATVGGLLAGGMGHVGNYFRDGNAQNTQAPQHPQAPITPQNVIIKNIQDLDAKINSINNNPNFGKQSADEIGATIDEVANLQQQKRDLQSQLQKMPPEYVPPENELKAMRDRVSTIAKKAQKKEEADKKAQEKKNALQQEANSAFNLWDAADDMYDTDPRKPELQTQFNLLDSKIKKAIQPKIDAKRKQENQQEFQYPDQQSTLSSQVIPPQRGGIADAMNQVVANNQKTQVPIQNNQAQSVEQNQPVQQQFSSEQDIDNYGKAYEASKQFDMIPDFIKEDAMSEYKSEPVQPVQQQTEPVVQPIHQDVVLQQKQFVKDFLSREDDDIETSPEENDVFMKIPEPVKEEAAKELYTQAVKDILIKKTSGIDISAKEKYIYDRIGKTNPGWRQEAFNDLYKDLSKDLTQEQKDNLNKVNTSIQSLQQIAQKGQLQGQGHQNLVDAMKKIVERIKTQLARQEEPKIQESIANPIETINLIRPNVQQQTPNMPIRQRENINFPPLMRKLSNPMQRLIESKQNIPIGRDQMSIPKSEKQPYEMTQEEYYREEFWKTPNGHHGRGTSNYNHKLIVKQAIDEGRLIPQKVLAEYPNLNKTVSVLPNDKPSHEIKTVLGGFSVIESNTGKTVFAASSKQVAQNKLSELIKTDEKKRTDAQQDIMPELIGVMFDSAMSNPDGKETNQYGKKSKIYPLPYLNVSPEMAERIKKETSVDVSGMVHALDHSGIRHVMKEHGSETTEKSRGQIPITKSDFEMLPEIISNPDKIESVGENQQNLESIRFVKKINGHVFIIEEARTGSNRLVVKTMYKRNNKEAIPAAPRAMPENRAAHTSETFDSEPLNQNMQQKEDNVNSSSGDKESQSLKSLANKTEIHTPSGEILPAHYEAINIYDLIHSGMKDFYPQELQPRNRDLIASKDQVLRISQNLIPEKLISDYPGAETGPMVVVRLKGELIVLSGNGRIMALLQAIENKNKNIDKAFQNYFKLLEEKADSFGIKPPLINNVLVRVLDGNYTTEELRKLAIDMNKSEQLSMTGLETGKSDIAAVKKFIDRYKDGSIELAKNSDFVGKLLSEILTKNEISLFVSNKNELTNEGKNRINRALFISAYGDSPLSQMFVEEIDPNIKGIINQLLEIAPEMIKINMQIEKNRLPDLSLSAQISNAAKKMSQLRNQGRTVREWVMNPPLPGMEEDSSTIVRDILYMFEEFKRSPAKIGQTLSTYNEGIRKLGNQEFMTLMGEEVKQPTRGELLKASIRSVKNEGKQTEPTYVSNKTGSDEAVGKAIKPEVAEKSVEQVKEDDSEFEKYWKEYAKDSIPERKKGDLVYLIKEHNGYKIRDYKRTDGTISPKPPNSRVMRNEDALREVYEAGKNVKKSVEKTVEKTKQAQEEEPIKEAEKSKSGIQDFGEKIGGAKKDRIAIAEEPITDEELASKKLSEIWPKKEIDDIEDDFRAAVSDTARRLIPAKPKKSFNILRWVETVKVLLKLRSLPVETTKADIGNMLALRKAFTTSGFTNFMSRVKLLVEISRDQWNRIGEVQEKYDAYQLGKQLGKDRERIPKPTVIVDIDNKHHWIEGKTFEEVLPKIKEILDVEQGDKKTAFEIRSMKSGKMTFIVKKGDPLYRKLKIFDKVEDARAFLKNNYDEVVKAWEDVKEKDNVKETDVRREENKPRSGADHRQGKDVTPEMFKEAFGFRGVEFGNWVSQGSNKKERQGMLNEAHDALMDMASILNIPTQAISLNGSLAIGFGSRGSGKASAHYESGKVVINLTKTKGAGALAHEFFHALDNYFQKQRPGASSNQAHGGNFITYNPETIYKHKSSNTKLAKSRFDELIARNGIKDAENWIKIEGVRPQVEEAFSNVVKALDKSPMAERSALIGKGKSNGYWGRIIERAARSFENYIIAKMEEKGYRNDYLANVVAPEDFKRSGDRYPYLYKEELKPISEAFDKLFSEIKTKKTEKGIALYSAEYLLAQKSLQAAKWSLRKMRDLFNFAVDQFNKGVDFLKFQGQALFKFGKDVSKYLSEVWNDAKAALVSAATRKNPYGRRGAIGVESNKTMRDNNVPASPEVFKLIGIPKGRIYADYNFLSERHKNYFPTQEDAKKAVEYVLSDPEFSTKEKNGLVGLVRTASEGDRKFKHPKVKIRIEARPDGYHVRSVHLLSDSQVERDKESRSLGDNSPSPASSPFDEENRNVQPASDKNISKNGTEVKKSQQQQPIDETESENEYQYDVTKDFNNIMKFFRSDIDRIIDISVLTNEEAEKDLGKPTRSQDGTVTKGYIDRYEKGRIPKMVLVQGNIENRNDAIMTIAHEVIGHYGMEHVAGSDFNWLMSELKKHSFVFNEKDSEFKKSRIETLSRYKQENKDTDTFIRESLAVMIERGYGDASFWEKIKSMVNRLLRRIGFKKDLQLYEVKDLLSRARRWGHTRFSLIQTPRKVWQNRTPNQDKKFLDDVVKRNVSFSQSAPIKGGLADKLSKIETPGRAYAEKNVDSASWLERLREAGKDFFMRSQRLKSYESEFFKALFEINPETAKTPEELKRQLTRIEQGILENESTDEKLAKHFGALGQNYLIYRTFEKIMDSIDKYVGTPELKQWFMRKLRRSLTSLLLHDKTERLLARLGERIYWNGDEMVASPGFRVVDEEKGGYKYEQDAISGDMAMEAFNNLPKEMQNILTERARDNEMYRQEFVSKFIPKKIAEVTLNIMANEHGQGLNLDKGNIRKFREAISEIESFDPEYADKMNEIAHFIIDEGSTFAYEKEFYQAEKNNEDLEAMLKDLETNKGHFGYVHHTGIQQDKEADKYPSMVEEKPAFTNHDWFKNIESSRKYRKGQGGYIENLLFADLAQSRGKIRADQRNAYMQKVEESGIVAEDKDRKDKIKTQADLDKIRKGLDIDKWIIARFGALKGKKVFIAPESFDDYQLYTTKKTMSDNEKNIDDFTGFLATHIFDPINYALLSHPTKLIRDVVWGVPFHLMDMIQNQGIKYIAKGEYKKAVMLPIKAVSAIYQVFKPEVWNKLPKEKYGEYSEAVDFGEGQGRHWITRAIDAISIKAFNAPIGSVIGDLFNEINLAGAGDVPIKRMMDVISNQIADEDKITGVEKERFVRNFITEYAFETGDNSPVINWARGKGGTTASKLSGRLQRTTLPFFGYIFEVWRKLFSDPIYHGVYGGLTGKTEASHAIADVIRPIFWYAALTMLKGVAMPPEEDEIAGALQEIPGLDNIARTSGKVLIAKFPGIEGSEWYARTKDASFAGMMEVLSEAIESVQKGKPVIDTMSRAVQDFLSTHPAMTGSLAAIGFKRIYDQYTPVDTIIGKTIGMMLVPQMSRFSGDISKFVRWIKEDNSIPDNRKQSILEALSNQVLGTAEGGKQVHNGDVVRPNWALELLKGLGINLKEIKYKDSMAISKEGLEKVGHLEKKLRALQFDIKRNKDGKKSTEKILSERGLSKYSDLSQAEEALVREIGVIKGGLTQAMTNLSKQGFKTPRFK